MKNTEIRESLDISENIETMPKVNLDALIPKADFAEDKSVQGATDIKFLNIQHLMPRMQSGTSLYHLLRKPDFQRETNNWDKKRIKELIECYIDGSFIPSIILWQNPTNKTIYVIDGAHRLSALLAWINNDYGDAAISQNYYQYTQIPEEERLLADETRKYINDKVGSFEDIVLKGGPTWDNILTRNLDIQVITGGVKKAEDSFFKINQQGVVISTTEKFLCKFRDEPVSIATRIIMKGQAGYQYWKSFEDAHIKIVPALAAELHTMLFEPPYKEKSTSVIFDPLAGSVTGAIQVIYELVKLASLGGKEPEKTTKEKVEINDTLNGIHTTNYLRTTRRVCRVILSQEIGSLGLFPSIYFYNSVGKFIEGSFLGMACLILEKERDSDTQFKIAFTKARKRMELFLVNNKVFLTQISRKFGSAEKSTRHFKGFFDNIIKMLNDIPDSEYNEVEFIELIKKKYEYLNEKELDYKKPTSGKPNPDKKRSLSRNEEILSQPKCKICQGIIHPLSKDWDHKEKHEKGGRGLSDNDNLQSTHVFCNNSREKLVEIGFYKP